MATSSSSTPAHGIARQCQEWRDAVLVRVACNGQKGARQVPPHRTEGSTPAVTTNARTGWLRLLDERQAQLAAGG